MKMYTMNFDIYKNMIISRKGIFKHIRKEEYRYAINITAEYKYIKRHKEITHSSA